MLEYLITSGARRGILGLFLKNPDERFYLRQVAYKLQEGVSTIQRELSNLEEWGFLFSTMVGNLRFYYVNSKFSFLPELQALFQKEEQIKRISYVPETVIDWGKHRQRLLKLKEKENKYEAPLPSITRKKPRSATEQKIFKEIEKRKRKYNNE